MLQILMLRQRYPLAGAGTLVHEQLQFTPAYPILPHFIGYARRLSLL
ncbi:hypothetical protein [Rugamonas rubra]|nr:hypothetical protein [Rugamonas rubra]